jgi:transposase
MRPPCLLPPSAERKLARQLDQAATKTEYRRVLRVWLRASLGMPAAEIATALGCSVGTVHHLHSQYLREGDSALAVCARGGRHQERLTAAAEGKLLAPFASIAEQGEITEVSAVRTALEQQVGQAVAKSTVYRLRQRQGWRKLAPRPFPPDASLRAQEAFKKSSGVWSAPSLLAKPNGVSVCG